MTKTKDYLEKLLEINLITKNYLDNKVEDFFDLEKKILFYIFYNAPCCPGDIMDIFRIKKTNLAIICNNLIKQNLLEKQKNDLDGRAIIYKLTPNGTKKIDEIINKFENCNLLNNKNFISQADELIKTINK